MVRNLFLVSLGALVLGGCTPSTPAATEAAGGQSFSRDMSVADRTACITGGGRVERRGRIGAELCVKPFADAGKQCTDTAQCAGKCVGTADQASATGPISGQCQADDRLFGCYSEIKAGKAMNAICVD